MWAKDRKRGPPSSDREAQRLCIQTLSGENVLLRRACASRPLQENLNLFWNPSSGEFLL
jgi:hypothetical protein